MPKGFEVWGSSALCDVHGFINDHIITFQGIIIAYITCSWITGHPEFHPELMKALLLSRRGIIPDAVLDEVITYFNLTSSYFRKGRFKGKQPNWSTMVVGFDCFLFVGQQFFEEETRQLILWVSCKKYGGGGGARSSKIVCTFFFFFWLYDEEGCKYKCNIKFMTWRPRHLR